MVSDKCVPLTNKYYKLKQKIADDTAMAESAKREVMRMKRNGAPGPYQGDQVFDDVYSEYYDRLESAKTAQVDLEKVIHELKRENCWYEITPAFNYVMGGGGTRLRGSKRRGTARSRRRSAAKRRSVAKRTAVRK